MRNEIEKKRNQEKRKKVLKRKKRKSNDRKEKEKINFGLNAADERFIFFEKLIYQYSPYATFVNLYSNTSAG